MCHCTLEEDMDTNEVELTGTAEIVKAGFPVAVPCVYVSLASGRRKKDDDRQ